MNLDSLLTESRPEIELDPAAENAIDQMVQQRFETRRRPRPRPRFLVGIAVVIAVVLGGGVSAAAASGLIHPTWYDPDSDWTTEVKTVDRTFTVDTKQYHCTLTLSLGSTYNGKGTVEFQKALSYMRSLDPTSIKPTAAQIKDLYDATWQGPGPAPAPPSKPWANEQVWFMDVANDIFDHMREIGLDPNRIRLSVPSSHCDFAR